MDASADLVIEPTKTEPLRCQRDFATKNSKGERSIAKNGYVKSISGWFSCRRSCYLAAGKPILVQDTSWSDHLPSGHRLSGLRLRRKPLTQ
jgi:hypothetical protein